MLLQYHIVQPHKLQASLTIFDVRILADSQLSQWLDNKINRWKSVHKIIVVD